MRISDWSSDVCSSDLHAREGAIAQVRVAHWASHAARRRRKWLVDDTNNSMAASTLLVAIGGSTSAGIGHAEGATDTRARPPSPALARNSSASIQNQTGLSGPAYCTYLDRTRVESGKRGAVAVSPGGPGYSK